MERFNLGKSAPDLYQALVALDRLVSQSLASAGIAEGFAHLLRLRASQINGCSYCVKVHTRDALSKNESIDRAALVAAWRESQYFTEKERAALELVEAITLISDGQVPDSVYEAAAQKLNQDEIVAIEWLAVVMNAWNRVAISSRYPVKP